MKPTSQSSSSRKRWWIAGIAALGAAITLPLFSSQVLADDDHEERETPRSERRVDFFLRAKAAHFCHLHGPFGKAVFERLAMLLGQQGGGG